ncbi:MAG: aminoglycoside 6'-N-acetyltransferase [bacterium]
MKIRPVTKLDRSQWMRMRCALWPGDDSTHANEIDRFFAVSLREPKTVLVADEDGVLKGFIELSIRAYAEGCVTDRITYLEGLYVEEEARGQGIGRALVAAAEDWARSKGCIEFASDAELDNEVSARIHKSLGFEEVGQIRCFRKSIKK